MTGEIFVKPLSYIYEVISFDNYDGDSFDIHIVRSFDFGFHRTIMGAEPINVRLYGVDTPELRGGTDDSKAAARLARDRARQFCLDAIDKNDLIFESYKYKKGKYGRPLGDFIRVSDNQRLSTFLLNERLGVKYHGQSKAEIQPEHDANIAYLKEKNLI